MNERAANEPHRLDVIQIRNPCTEDWSKMQGDERVRFCGVCQQNVFNLSAMTSEAAEALIAETEGRLCIRLYKRPDGTVITQDCGPSRTAQLSLLARRATRWAASVCGVAVAGLLGLGMVARQEDREGCATRSRLPPLVLEMLDPLDLPIEPPTEPSYEVMGDLAVPMMGAYVGPIDEEEGPSAEERVRDALEGLEQDRGFQAILENGGQAEVDLDPDGEGMD